MEILKTDRLTLRSFRESDFVDVLKIYEQPDVCRYLLHEVWSDNVDAKKAFLKKVSNHTLDENAPLSVAIVLDSKVIGDIDCWYTGMKDSVEVGFTFNPKFQGKGYASEALTAIFRYLFSKRSVHRISAMLDARNQASKGLCERVQMRQEAHFIQDYWSKGEWTDTYVFGILASEYASMTQ